jgi:hypothetical protein
LYTVIELMSANSLRNRMFGAMSQLPTLPTTADPTKAPWSSHIYTRLEGTKRQTP